MMQLLVSLIFVSVFNISHISAQDMYSIPLKTIEGKSTTLDSYKGKVLLIVNTASKCGFTPQYKDLQSLYDSYKDKDLVVLGFPSNDFKEQEPGTNDDIKQFCQLRYGVTFPLFDKASVTGEAIQPLYKYLLSIMPEEDKGEVKWNFEKIVLDKKGQVRGRFGSFVNPKNSRITTLIEKLIAE